MARLWRLIARTISILAICSLAIIVVPKPSDLSYVTTVGNGVELWVYLHEGGSQLCYKWPSKPDTLECI